MDPLKAMLARMDEHRRRTDEVAANSVNTDRPHGRCVSWHSVGPEFSTCYACAVRCSLRVKPAADQSVPTAPLDTRVTPPPAPDRSAPTAPLVPRVTPAPDRSAPTAPLDPRVTPAPVRDRSAPTVRSSARSSPTNWASTAAAVAAARSARSTAPASRTRRPAGARL